jgi:HAD superfamily hydrolase (TIGR01484 family)
MTYKLIALDIDGTLLNRDRKISAENNKWIRAAIDTGKKVILATGRPIHEVMVYAEQLNLDLPLIVNNGSEIWKSPSKLHSRNELDAKGIKRILDFVNKYAEGVEFWAHIVGGRIDAVNLPLNLQSVQWLQFAVQTTNDTYLREIYDELMSWNAFEISNSNPTNVECNALGISKASGLLAVCDMLGIRISEVIAVGDSLNDVSMIRASGLGVAMGNAQEKVKQSADVIALSNDDDGVAAIIQQYLL